MVSILTTATLAAGLLAPPSQQVAMMGMGCADTAIVGVHASRPHLDATGRNAYRIAVTVKNVGDRGQSGSVLDSVAMSEYGERTDVKGLQPLPAGASQTVFFIFRRSAEAGLGTAPLRFAVVYTSGQDCNPSNDVARINL